MKTFKSLVFVAIAGLMASCSSTMPLTATDNAMSGKVGKATNNCLSYAKPPRLANGDMIAVSGGLCFNDDKYDIYNAAMNGGISKVATVDLKVTSYILFYKYELIVTGE
jgi:hypothetical protein